MNLKRMLWLCIIVSFFTVFLVPGTVQAQNPIWTSDFYDNPYLSGDPVLSRSTTDIAFDWGLGSPASGVPADYFSVRWSTDVVLDPGTYRFWARADDDIRVIFDFGTAIIDTFDQQAVGQLVSADVTVSETNSYHIQVDYRELTHNAYAYVAFANTAGNPTVPPFGSPVPPAGTGAWTASYFSNSNLSGSPTVILNEADPTHFWGANQPYPTVPADNFSARWTSTQSLNGGNYQIRANADDGVRVYVDNNLVLDEWHLATAQTYNVTVALTPGQHNFTVEYYEAGGAAFLDFDLLQVGSPPAPPPPPVDTGVTATVLASRLNVRDFPSTDTGNVIAQIAINETYPVLARNAENTWYLLQVHDVQGWVSARWVTVDPANPTLPIGNPANPPAPPPVSDEPTVTANPFNVNVRTGPGTEFNRIARLGVGRTAEVIGRNAEATWWQIDYAGIVGWVSAEYALLEPGVDINTIPVTG